jgi:hypothetical protein
MKKQATKVNEYQAVKQAIAAIEQVMKNPNMAKEVRAEFAINKKNLENLLRFL